MTVDQITKLKIVHSKSPPILSLLNRLEHFANRIEKRPPKYIQLSGPAELADRYRGIIKNENDRHEDSEFTRLLIEVGGLIQAEENSKREEMFAKREMANMELNEKMSILNHNLQLRNEKLQFVIAFFAVVSIVATMVMAYFSYTQNAISLRQAVAAEKSNLLMENSIKIQNEQKNKKEKAE